MDLRQNLQTNFAGTELRLYKIDLQENKLLAILSLIGANISASVNQKLFISWSKFFCMLIADVITMLFPQVHVLSARLPSPLTML